jgi:hypothetical protein
MKISIVSAIWERPELTEIFLKSLQRYEKDYGIQSAVAGSEGVQSREMCLDYGIAYVESPNEPLSDKFNAAAQLANVCFSPDAFLVLGSDDFVDDTLIKRYLKVLEKGVDIVGIKDCYFYHTGSREAAYWCGYTNFRKGETVGMARMLSKKVFNELDGQLWPSKMNSGLDYTMMTKIKSYEGFTWRSFSIKGMMAVDIKGQGNITRLINYDENLTEVDISTFDTIPEFSLIRKL